MKQFSCFNTSVRYTHEHECNGQTDRQNYDSEVRKHNALRTDAR